jgi:hypothetical protein
VRGIRGGNGDETMDATMQVNCAVQPYYQVDQTGSHTLQIRDRERRTAVCAKLIDTTVDTNANGSAPRLDSSRSWA